MNPRVVRSDRFCGGAPMRLEGWIGLIKPDDLRIRIRAVLVVLIGWIPLVLLTVLDDFRNGGNSLSSLVLDFGSVSRYVVAAPLLVLAESECFARFERIIFHFRDSGLIASRDTERYEGIVRSSARLLTSKTAEIICFVVAYAVAAYCVTVLAPNTLIPWSYDSDTARTSLSLAGKWHAFVSAPLLMVLVLGWIWRQFSWARFLWLVSRLDLQLLPTHPDLCGGLNFVSTVTRAYRLIGFAFTTIVAGGIANRLVHSGAHLMAYRDLIICITALVALFCLAPLAVFVPVLRRLRARAIFEYGSLAREVGDVLGQKWLSRRANIQPDVLEVPDFSSTTDLYSIVANVYRISHLPVSFAAFRELLIFVALPFVPVLLIAAPVKEIFDAFVRVAIS
jgi:hypothetical protein